MCLLGLLLLAGGCATYYNPVTAKTEYTMYTEQDEQDMGKAVDQKLRTQYRITSNARINAIGQRLVRVSDRPGLTYQFGLAESKEINAFAIPGGYLYVFTGLVNMVSSDDELASVMAHELAHIASRDSVHMMEKQVLYSVPASVLFGSGRYPAIQQAVDTAFNLGMLKYSRTEELAADTIGVKYLYRAGYDPRAMITFFQKLAKMDSSLTTQFEFLKSHPDFNVRITNVETVIRNLQSTSSGASQWNLISK